MGIVAIISGACRGGGEEKIAEGMLTFFSKLSLVPTMNLFLQNLQFFQHFTFLYHIQVYTHRRVIRRWGGGMGRGMNERT